MMRRLADWVIFISSLLLIPTLIYEYESLSWLFLGTIIGVLMAKYIVIGDSL